MICVPTLNKTGSASESGKSREPIRTAIAGINHADRFAYRRASASAPSPIFFPMMIPAPFPTPIKNTHVSWEIVPVILNAASASVLACEKIEFSVVIPKLHSVSFTMTGNAILTKRAKKSRLNEKSSAKRPHASYFFRYAQPAVIASSTNREITVAIAAPCTPIAGTVRMVPKTETEAPKIKR